MDSSGKKLDEFLSLPFRGKQPSLKQPGDLQSSLKSALGLGFFHSFRDAPDTSHSCSDLHQPSFWPDHGNTTRSRPIASCMPLTLRYGPSKKQMASIFLILLALLIWALSSTLGPHVGNVTVVAERQASSPYQILRPVLPKPISRYRPDPERWLKENSEDKFSETKYTLPESKLQKHSGISSVSIKPRAAIISLVRNSELDGIMQSMQQLEWHWNDKYHYPWVFFNNEPFTQEFKASNPRRLVSR